VGQVFRWLAQKILQHVSKARISQIMNLIHLAPAIQEAILFLLPIPRGRAPLVLANLQPIAVLADWAKQERAWRILCAARNVRELGPET
jgi:hypothetical protein